MIDCDKKTCDVHSDILIKRGCCKLRYEHMMQCEHYKSLVAEKAPVAKLHCSDGLSGLEIHIILDEKDPPNPAFVEIENKQGQSIGIGRREMMPCGLTWLVITVEDMIEKA